VTNKNREDQVVSIPKPPNELYISDLTYMLERNVGLLVTYPKILNQEKYSKGLRMIKNYFNLLLPKKFMNQLIDKNISQFWQFKLMIKNIQNILNDDFLELKNLFTLGSNTIKYVFQKKLIN